MKDKWLEYVRDTAYQIIPSAVTIGLLTAFVHAWDNYHGFGVFGGLPKILIVNGLSLWFVAGHSHVYFKKYPWYIVLITFAFWITLNWISATLLLGYLRQTV